MIRRPLVVASLSTALLLTLCACTSGVSPAGSTGGDAVFPDEAVADTVAQLPQESVAPMPANRLAEGLIPPTNRWFSGLVFGEAPEPVFPLPLTFSLTDTGFAFGVPVVQTGADTIITGPSSDVSAAFPASVDSTVVAYDDASVTIELRDADDTALGTVTVAEGSPIVAFTAEASTTISMATPPAPANGGDVFTTEVAGQQYGMISDGTVTGSDVALQKGDTVTWFAVPEGADAQALASSANGVTGVTASFSVTDQDATTSLAYATADDQDTLIAALPHQVASLTAPDACDLGTYETVYGTMQLCSGRELSWTAPTMQPSDALPIDGLDDATKAALRTQLAIDVQLPVELPADTYFGGKALYRLANLLQLAVQLDDTASADIVRARLVEELTDWTDPTRCDTQSTKCFVYDPIAKGLVGKDASFGAAEFNDHHFHYGYFLYAASIAVADDPALMDQLRPVMDLVAAELGTDSDSSFFPSHRVFDAYAGHSWASGYVPFRDGNNQESSSEAVAAWNGLALWADVTEHAALADGARWMLANEAATAQAYWIGFDRSEPVYDGYAHSIVALNWGSKRDYSTWFSAEPNAKLGIQLLPMAPANSYLAGDAERITENLAEATAGGYGVQFGDYLLMYAALRGPEAAADAYTQVTADPSTPIDDANSRAYLLAFLASHAAAR
ncbi:glycosyl hydrolase [Microbacterium sp.]|uniref:glycosyl hydrolase n=1 Tax=Microbacterium sp. TaxID=51671 RepID=UPI002E35FA3B|nr:glycosyl hydrolase [Microbacterium sp.]HEX5728945.1 glycosyl hydrolase [Microbacterium sp.]